MLTICAISVMVEFAPRGVTIHSTKPTIRAIKITIY